MSRDINDINAVAQSSHLNNDVAEITLPPPTALPGTVVKGEELSIKSKHSEPDIRLFYFPKYRPRSELEKHYWRC